MKRSTIDIWVGAFVAAGFRPGHAQRRQHLRHLLEQRHGLGLHAAFQLVHAAGAEVAFAYQLVLDILVAVAIGARAVKAVCALCANVLSNVAKNRTP